MKRAVEGFLAGLLILSGSLVCRAAEPAAAAKSGEPVAVLDARSVWRIHEALKPPVIQFDDAVRPITTIHEWLDRETFRRDLDKPGRSKHEEMHFRDRNCPYDLTWGTCEIRGVRLAAGSADGLVPNAIEGVKVTCDDLRQGAATIAAAKPCLYRGEAPDVLWRCHKGRELMWASQKVSANESQ